MKKLFTLAAAVLASIGLMAAEPTFESYDWENQAAAEAVAGNHDGIVISYAGLGNPGNVSGHWYIPNNQNLKNSDSEWKYFGIAAGTQIDSVAFLYCPNGSNATSIAWAAWGQGVTPNQYILGHGVTAGTKSSKSWDNAIWETIDLTGIEAYTVYMSRSIREFREIGGTSNIPNFGGGQTINILGVRVWLHETKTIVSTVETLTAVTINDVAISATDLASLVSNMYLFLADAYVTAPVVKFTKHTVITYDDASTKEKDEVIEVTSQPATTTWGASATINGNSYYVYTSKAASRTVTYMYGEQVLGTETVAVNGNPAEYAQYETMPLATFGGWYKDADLTQAVANIAAEVISADATYYAKFTKAYAQSLNIEQLVLDNSTKYDIKAELTAKGYAYENIDALDSLNDLEDKANRNYAFLGLKLKTAGAYVACNLKAGDSIAVKFGNLPDSIKVGINGVYQFMPKNSPSIGRRAAADEYLELITTTKSTVVLKQIMINEPLAEVVLPAPGAYMVNIDTTIVNGKVTANWENKKYRAPIGAVVTLTVTPDEGYVVEDVQVNGVSLNAVENVYSFEMPAEDVEVTATFASDGTALVNTEANAAAQKVMRNGQLLIIKGEKVYTTTGVEVK